MISVDISSEKKSIFLVLISQKKKKMILPQRFRQNALSIFINVLP